MALPFWPRDPGPWGERHFSTKRGFGCSCDFAEPSLVVDENAILEGADHEIAFAVGERCQEGVGIGLAIHHVDCLRPVAEKHLGVVDAVQPARSFSAALRAGPILMTDRLVAPKDCLEREQPE